MGHQLNKNVTYELWSCASMFSAVSPDPENGICKLGADGKYINPYGNFTLLETLRFYVNATYYNDPTNNDEYTKVMNEAGLTLSETQNFLSQTFSSGNFGWLYG
jgi:hypothetical protein